MRMLLLATLAVALFAGSPSAHEGRLALFADMNGSVDYGTLAAGDTLNLLLFYLKGDGPVLGNAVEFKLSLSTGGAAFKAPVWASDVILTLGTIEDGIALTGNRCLGSNRYGEAIEAAYIGTIPVVNLSEMDGFVARVEGVMEPVPIITICTPDQPIYGVQGGEFRFNTVVQPTLVGAEAPAGNVVLVSFSRQMDPSSAANAGNYEVYDSLQPADVVPVASAHPIGAAAAVQLSLGAHMTHGVSYTLRVNNVRAVDMLFIVPNSEVSFTYIDSIPPALLSVRALSLTSIALNFNEALDPASAEIPENYAVHKAGAMQPAQVISATLTGAQTVTLTLADPLELMALYSVTAANISDPAGNVMALGTVEDTLITLALTHVFDACCQPEMDLYVPWQVSDPVHGIASTCLFYRSAGATGWTELCENNPINPVVMAIPGSAIGASGVEYYITATSGIGTTVNRGAPDAPYVVPVCSPPTCVRPILWLGGYVSVSYVPPIWKVRVCVINMGPGTAKNINATMNADISWLAIPDPHCGYGDIPAYGESVGEVDGYSFDLTNYPGGSFNAWFDVTYFDSCGNRYQVRLDPEFSIDAEDNGPVSSAAYRLAQNYPNPFNPATTIGYELPAPSRVILRIFDVSGRLVRTLVNENKGPGAHGAVWDGTDGAGVAVSSGIYFYKLQAGDYVETKRMVLLR